MLPVSICVHVAIGLAALIVPLGADEWPVPAPLHSPFVTTKTVPAPPSTAPRVASRRAPAVNVSVPAAIGPERDITPEPNESGPPAIPVDGAIDVGGIAPGAEVATVVPPPPPVPPTIPSPPSVVRVGQGVREPKKIVDVRPTYPAIALSVKVQGPVMLEAVINEQGVVERIKVLRSIPLLDGAAIAAVQAWRYTPTTLNGVPVSVLMTITINFTLHD
jgi:protein TonB